MRRIFVLGAAFTLYPRPDNVQKGIFVAMMLLTFCYLFKQFTFQELWKKQIKLSFQIWFFCAISLSIISPFKNFKNKQLSQLSHFKHIVLDIENYKHLKSMKKTSKNFDSQTFFLSTHGGFYYLLFDLKNPTPFDYPIQPAIGPFGEEKIIELIKRQKISQVLMDHERWTNWKILEKDRRPQKLEAFIEKQMVETGGSLKEIFQYYKANI